MAIHMSNERAEALVRKVARIANVGITDAALIAMREAIEHRMSAETPVETAARLRKKHGIDLTDEACQPFARNVLGDMWERA